MKPEIAFGEALRYLRNSKNISQERLAFDANLDRTFISLLERGLRQPSLTTIIQLADALDIQPEELISIVKKNIELPQRSEDQK